MSPAFDFQNCVQRLKSKHGSCYHCNMKQSIFENRSHICFSVIWNNIRSPVSWSHLVNWSLIYIHLLQKDLCPEVYYAYWLERVKYKQQGKERKRKNTDRRQSIPQGPLPRSTENPRQPAYDKRMAKCFSTQRGMLLSYIKGWPLHMSMS